MRGWDRLVVAFMTVLLTALLFNAIPRSAGTISRALGALDLFVIAENDLHRDVLSSSAGLLPHYDSLALHVDTMEHAMHQLWPTLEDEEQRSLGRQMVANLGLQMQLTERFKTSNALVRNSLAYFAEKNARAGSGEVPPSVRAASARLSSAVLSLSIAATESARSEVDQSIADLEAKCRIARCTGDVDRLLAHGRILQTQVPASQDAVKSLIRCDTPASLDRLRALLTRKRQAAETVAGRYRTLLYVCSLVLLLLLVRWGLRIRAHSLAMRRKLALEHVVSRFSTRLIAASDDSIESEIRAMLGDLSNRLDARFALMQLGEAGLVCFSQQGLLSDGDVGLLARLSRHHSASHRNDVTRLSSKALRSGTPARMLLERLDAGSLYFIEAQPEGATRQSIVIGLPRCRVDWRTVQFKVLKTALDAACLASERAAGRRERAALRVQLEHAGRMETIGAFASGVAHNFNNLLGAIDGHGEMAAACLDPEAPAASHIEQIRASAERGRQLISGLLHYGRRRIGLRQQIDLARLLTECRSTATAALDDVYDVQLDEAAKLIVSGDPSELLQVFLNLINNAAQAMPGGGVIRIGVAVDPAMEGTAPSREFAAVTVEDEGRGLTSDLLDQVYEPFFTTRPGGTGLGLSTARDIVREHGGELMLQSAAGKGAVAVVRLPLAANVDHPGDRGWKGAGQTVLYLAPTEPDRLAGEELLAALGYEPQGFTLAERAIGAFIEEPDRFDVVLAAGGKFDAGTESLFSEARRRRPRIQRILGLKHPKQQHAQMLASRGVTVILQFPFDPRELASALRLSNGPPRPGIGCAGEGRQAGQTAGEMRPDVPLTS
jgi:signal transduction histidine kinase